jgi:hypothetical protein
MDIEIITTDRVARELHLWQALAVARNHLWHGKALSFLPNEIDGYNLDLVGIVDGSLMKRLAIDIPSIEYSSTHGMLRGRCSAVRLTFGREIDLGPLWQREGLTDLFHILLYAMLKEIFDDLEKHMRGIATEAYSSGGAKGIHATGNYAYAAFEDVGDPAHPLVHVIVPAITYAKSVGWLFLDPRFWVANKHFIEDLVDGAMFDAYDRATVFHGVGNSAQAGRAA